MTNPLLKATITAHCEGGMTALCESEDFRIVWASIAVMGERTGDATLLRDVRQLIEIAYRQGFVDGMKCGTNMTLRAAEESLLRSKP